MSYLVMYDNVIDVIMTLFLVGEKFAVQLYEKLMRFSQVNVELIIF